MRVELPGLFDLQVNGFAGIDFNDQDLTADGVAHAIDRMRSTGVTRCLPTLITGSFDRFAACARVLAAVRDPAIAGFHMEGPYISPAEGARGAHPLDHIVPATMDDFKRRQEACDGRIRLVTLAPEVAGAVPLIEHLVDSGVRVAIGHTAGTPEDIAAGVAAGATLATHLGNGCPQMLPRHPNPIWELLAADQVSISLIADGHHLPGSTVKAMVRAKGADRTMLVTDAMAAAGCPAGRYAIGGVDCQLGENGRVSLPGTPYLAGSALTLDSAIGNAVRFTGLPLSTVVAMASTVPAAWLGETPRGIVTADWDEERAELHVVLMREGHLSPPLRPL